MLVEALRIYEDSLCKGCGHSGFLTYDQHENTSHFKVDTVICVSCEGLEARAKNVKADDEWPGTKAFSVNTMDEKPEQTGSETG